MRAIILAVAAAITLSACAAGFGITPPPKPIDQMTKVELCEYSVQLEADASRLSVLISAFAKVWGVDTAEALAMVQASIAKAIESRNIVCVVE